MNKITIKALVGTHNAVNINTLDNLECDDDFVEYIDVDLSSKLESGYMKFVVDHNILYTTTEYVIKDGQSLSFEEIQRLIKYTQGQWSDGIGEGFEQFPCTEENKIEIYVSPWYRGQVATYYLH